MDQWRGQLARSDKNYFPTDERVGCWWRKYGETRKRETRSKIKDGSLDKVDFRFLFCSSRWEKLEDIVPW